MRIKLDTLDKLPAAIDSYGDSVSELLNLGGHLREQPFALVEKHLFGSGGEIFTDDRYIKFKASRSLKKLKGKETVPYSEITEFMPGNGSTGLDWEFQGTSGKFTIGLVFYGSVKGILPRDVFWYQIKEFPPRSAVFFKLLSKVIPRTGISTEFKASRIKEAMSGSMAFLEGTGTAEDAGLKLNPGNARSPELAALQRAFSLFLAGAAASTEDSAPDFLDIFKGMDDVYVRILRKFMNDYNSTLGNIFNREQKIYEADDKFQRLSSLWYLRQIASLHFASKYLSEEENRAWPVKVLKPRARTGTRNNMRTLTIKLPEPEVYEEAISRLKGEE